MKTAIILGTSKNDGNTRKLVDSYVESVGVATIFDLEQFKFSFYDYTHSNSDDDFLKLIELLLDYEHFVFASPVYWYSMSAQLKVFFDRLSDLLTIRKEMGRKLKGKTVSVLATGYNEECPQCFSQPFELTANYLDMDYHGTTYFSIQNEQDLNHFDFHLKG